MTRKISAIFIISLLIVAFLGFSAFGAYKPNVAKAKKQQLIQKLSDQTPIKVEGADEYHGYTGSSSVDEGPQSLGFDENVPANPVSAANPPIGNPSPGTWIGTTSYDYQTNGSPLRRVDWRGTNLIQFAWMKKVNFGTPYDGRRISFQAYNANTGAWTQSTSGSGGSDIHAVLGMVSGYATLDVYPDGRPIIVCHYNPTGDGDAQNSYVWTAFAPSGGYFAYSCPIPDSTGQYWPDPQADYRYLWPSGDLQVDGTDTVFHVIAQQSKTGAGVPQRMMYFRKMGSAANCTWDYPPYKVDIAQDLAQVVTASRVSRKVAIVWDAGYTSPPGDTITPDRGQQLNDIYYQINTNMGAGGSWLPKVNVTKGDSSKPSWMAYTDLSALYGMDDYLHIVWDARMFDFSTQTFPMGVGSRVFHYSNLNPGKISVVKDANWEIPTDTGCWGGAWNTMSLVKMSISQCDGKFYCLFTQFNDMFNGVGDDCHNANWTANYGSGTANGELYISVSSNGGLNWDIARNLTNSYTPHCDSAVALGGTLECQSDMWATMSRFGKNSTGLDFSSIIKVDPSGSYSGPWYLDVFYVNDKYPGGCVQDQGIWTTNPMRWFRVPCVEPVIKPLLSLVPSAIADPAWTHYSTEKDSIVRIENIGNAYLHVSNIVTHYITGATDDWLGTDITTATISDGSDLAPNFANMSVKLNKLGHVTTGPKGYDGFIELFSDSPTNPDTLPVHLIIADTVQFPNWAGIHTASKRIIFNNAGNLGRGGWEHQNLDFTWYGGDCDTANNVSGANDNAAVYLYDASPFVLYASGGDTTLHNYIWNSDWLDNDGFRPTQGLTVDSTSGTINYPVASDPTWQISGLNYAKTGKFLTRDSLIGLECEYFMPTDADSSCFMIQKVKVFKNVNSGDTLRNIMLGELMDWDIPSDSGVENGSGADNSSPTWRKMMYCYGAEYGADTGTQAPWNDCILANERAGGFSYYKGYYVSEKKVGQIQGPPVVVPTDTVPIKGMFTGSNDNWQGGTGNFPPGTLYQKLWDNGNLFSGYEYWFSTSGDPDSEYIDLNMVAFYGSFKIGPKDTLVFVKILTTTKGQLTGKSIATNVDEARAWIKGRRGVGNCCNLPGDANNNGTVQATDVTYLINYVYKWRDRPPCMSEGDANGDGVISALDITRVINKLYKPALPAAQRTAFCPK